MNYNITSKFRMMAIMINYNGYKDTLEAVSSLQQSSIKCDILIVDNNSDNHEGKRLKESLQNIVVLCSKKNLGFSGANNLGISFALKNNYDYILLINNDTTVADNMIEELLKESEYNVVVSPAMYYYSSPNKLWFCGGKLSKITGRVCHYHKEMKEPFYCSFLTGCCWLVHNSIFRKVGNLSEEYFMYCEDTDFCIRLAIHNIRMKVVPKAKLWHKCGMSSTTGFSEYYMARNNFINLRKYKEFYSWCAVYIAVFYYILKICRFILYRHSEWRAIVWALLDAYHGRIGKTDRDFTAIDS
ncbi:glycosyltransferase family 2 protein [Selenomonas sp. AE3005]|uniref:glycosyltransferase family 2 protein n=1 Tax=Selenomonas sp. AE3005 TaxID=1485543 RepID=UPI000480653C|nr:glycosyltransferase family 2 protein [Selenomonas sp. AE3005]